MKIIIYLISLSSITLSFSQASDIVNAEKTFTILDEPATFPGGHKMLQKYLKKELVYPQLALEMSIEGNVFVQMIIEKDGSFSEELVVKGIGGGCDEEALRLIKKMPNWIPGKEKGNVVRQILIQRINFDLSKTKNKN